MAIIKWNPGSLINADRFFDDFFKSEFPALSQMNFSAEGSTMPAVNIKETDKTYELEVAAPGMDKKDFNVQIENGVMTISAQKEMENEQKEDNFTRREFSYTSFQRSFTLPEGADDANVEAKYKDGILRIVLPKKPEAQAQSAKKIKIS
ncbi:MAG: Hsp20/alpha crystallin family protein [Bacteroidetes bacterium]|nr:MAG: Hsp20/alpha crystallin family protein [Bacteroidota bacterium]